MAQNVLGIYGYRFDGETLTPITIAREDDTTFVGVLDTDRKGRTTVGVLVDDIDLSASHFYTFAGIARAARKAQTPVVLGRPVSIAKMSAAFRKEVARLTGRTLAEIVTAGWRLDSGDVSSNELDDVVSALNETYNN